LTGIVLETFLCTITWVKMPAQDLGNGDEHLPGAATDCEE